jgi:pachytene checkpoint protein 2
MVNITAVPYLNPHLINFNRLILLHGPSGTGKSTLCRALTHRLSVALYPRFRECRLIEMNTSSMFSCWFGESASLVDQCFNAAFDRAADPETFVCLLIDEIESIAGSREKALGAQEVADSARATCQLLIELDKMRSMPNILMFCTTNLISTVVCLEVSGVYILSA